MHVPAVLAGIPHGQNAMVSPSKEKARARKGGKAVGRKGAGRCTTRHLTAVRSAGVGTIPESVVASIAVGFTCARFVSGAIQPIRVMVAARRTPLEEQRKEVPSQLEETSRRGLPHPLPLQKIHHGAHDTVEWSTTKGISGFFSEVACCRHRV